MNFIIFCNGNLQEIALFSLEKPVSPIMYMTDIPNFEENVQTKLFFLKRELKHSVCDSLKFIIITFTIRGIFDQIASILRHPMIRKSLHQKAIYFCLVGIKEHENGAP